MLASLTLDLTKNGKPQSTLIYGRNGTGKSSITDAWEWFRNYKIEHLAREGAGPSSYPNFAAQSGETFVEIEFSTSSLGTLRLTYDHDKITKPQADGSFTDLLRLTPHPCHICFADLTRFVYLTKTDRYDLLAQFMGFLPQVEVQKALRRVQRQFQDRVDALRARFSDAKKTLATKIGQDASNIEELAKILNEPLTRNNLVPPSDITDLKALVEKLRISVQQDPIAVRLSAIKELAKVIRGIAIPEQSLTAIKDYISVSQPFKEKEEELKGILLIGLYEQSLEAITKLGQADTCPLCGHIYDGDLCEHVETKLTLLKELKIRHDAANGSHTKALRATTTGEIRLDTLLAILGQLEGDPAIGSSQTLMIELAGINRLYSSTATLLSAKPAETDSQTLVELGKQAGELASALKSAVQQREKSLRELSLVIEAAERDTARAQLVSDFEILTGAADAFPKQLTAAAALSGYSNLAVELAEQIDAFVAACMADVSKRFAEISQDVATFFHILEEDSPGLGDPMLRILEDQDRAVVPDVVLHGRNVSPAYKYLSESQLNSFGLAVFLASVKRFNPEFDFILLDDVVNSLDGYKRPHLLRIIRSYFADKQVLLLTHDNVWRDRIVRELPGWKRIHFKRHEVGIGPIMAEPDTTLEEIQQLIHDDKARDAGQKLGPLMEAELQDLCEQFEVELKYNKRGEYTLEPLLTGLRSRVKEKLKSLHALTEELSKLSEESGFRNLCAHSKNPDIDITPEEMSTVLQRWKSIQQMVRCQDTLCSELLRWVDPHFACRCGKSKLVKVAQPSA